MLTGAAVYGAQHDSVFPDGADAHGRHMLDTHPRARMYEETYIIEATEAQFSEMQKHYRATDFDTWAERLRHLQPGMTEKQVIGVLRPKEIAARLYHGSSWSYIIVLNDAYFADVEFNPRTRRMVFATTPLAITVRN